ncbi:hypothetical protein M440DRAFT_1016210 [Trichoderma longibrachiatum ATCC 18648]|uniref:Uncharacterized protein n=1 Tax=Trichoderma longibrachiatum ATCC 18648 TaxID=983965 RepID=A0A2T4CIQ2_TRILO|nr:hypothetical protein M440DRAFT_1016210 [Trichoderma longibrachiatum ATCC 18648]
MAGGVLQKVGGGVRAARKSKLPALVTLIAAGRRDKRVESNYCVRLCQCSVCPGVKYRYWVSAIMELPALGGTTNSASINCEETTKASVRYQGKSRVYDGIINQVLPRRYGFPGEAGSKILDSSPLKVHGDTGMSWSTCAPTPARPRRHRHRHMLWGRCILAVCRW